MTSIRLDRTDRSPRPRLRTFDVPLIELVRPDGWWPQPFSLEQAFEIFRWMAAEAEKHTTAGGWRHPAVDLLSATSGVGYSSVIPIRSIEDLRGRFHYAILGRASDSLRVRWREALNIDVSATVRVAMRVFKPFAGVPRLGFTCERDVHDVFKRISIGSIGTTMAWSLNSIHRSCRTLHHVNVAVSARGFRFLLSYGDPLNTTYSRWTETIAETRADEPFLCTLARARDLFDMLVHGRGEADTGDMNDFCRNRMCRADEIDPQVAA